MVSFLPKGRCGNFLFETASSLGYAYRHGIPFSIPTSSRDPFWNPTYLAHLANPFYDGSLKTQLIQEKQHNYYELPKPEDGKKNIILDGYWQSYKYFEFCRPEILQAFQFEYQQIPGTVALHVRRGDYLRYPTINPLATRAYYEQAVKHFWLLGFKKFEVFSDDIPWCIQEFRDPVYKGCEFSFSQHRGILDDLTRMTWFEHIIMSNSTYAWWGAWLNQNPEKIVLCPHEDNYYGPANKHLDVSTLYPPEWIRLKY